MTPSPGITCATRKKKKGKLPFKNIHLDASSFLQDKATMWPGLVMHAAKMIDT